MHNTIGIVTQLLLVARHDYHVLNISLCFKGNL